MEEMLVSNSLCQTASTRLNRKLCSAFLVLLLSISGAFGQELNGNDEYYEIDHIIIFVNDTSLESALDKVFSKAEKLETTHKAQGTRGVYYLFLNSFIELLYLEDSTRAISNEQRFRSKYSKRWRSTKGFSKVGFVLRMNPFDTTRIKQEFERYESLDNPPGEYYVMFNGNRIVEHPLLAITLPHRQQKVFQSIDEAVSNAKPEIRVDLEKYLSHPSGIQKMTSIELGFRKKAATDNFAVLRSIDSVDIFKTRKNQLLLTFDNHRQNKNMKLTLDNLIVNIKY